MSADWVALTVASTEPDLPELREGLDESAVTPGLLGFLVIFAAALACLPLFRSMSTKLRGVEHRARLQAAAEAEAHGEASPRTPGQD